MKQDIICSGAPDAEMLGAAVGEFLRTVRPERQRLYDYYRGEQPVNYVVVLGGGYTWNPEWAPSSNLINNSLHN